MQSWKEAKESDRGKIVNVNYLNNLSENHKNICKTDSSKECLLKSIFRYLCNPIYNVPQTNKKTISKFWDVFRILSLSIIISLFLAIFISIALSIVGYNMDQHALSGLKNPVVIILSGIIIIPIIEELTFRMGLKFSPFRFSFSMALLSIIFISLIISISGVRISGLTALFLLIMILFLVGFVLGLFLKIRDNNLQIINFYRRNFGFIFYLSAIIFAGLHITNYGNVNQIWFLVPLLVAPQFVGGLLMGYVRMKYGLRWSIFQHMSFNAICFTPTIMIGFITITNVAMLVFFTVLGLTIVIAVLISSIQPVWEYFSQKHKQSSKLKIYQ